VQRSTGKKMRGEALLSEKTKRYLKKATEAANKIYDNLPKEREILQSLSLLEDIIVEYEETLNRNTKLARENKKLRERLKWKQEKNCG